MRALGSQSEYSLVDRSKSRMRSFSNSSQSPGGLTEFGQVLGAYIPRHAFLQLSSNHHAWMSEFRMLTIVFISIPQHSEWNRDLYSTALQKLQQCASTIGLVSKKWNGDIRQVLTDDKGTVAIVVFGLQNNIGYVVFTFWRRSWFDLFFNNRVFVYLSAALLIPLFRPV
jgi:hypothetical protein